MKIAITACLLASLILVGCKEQPKAIQQIRPVRVFTVQGDAAPETRSFPGKVKATREVSLAFRVAGQIVRLDVKEGDVVTKGQILATLDQRDYQAAIADLKATLTGARSVLNEAKLNMERSRKLVSERIIAQSEFDSAQSTYETSRAKVLSLEQSLRRANLNLQYTRLKAPFAGVIAVKEVDNHEYIQAKEPIVHLQDTSSLDVVLDVPEAVWIKAFKSGNTTLGHVAARFESYPNQTFPLTMKEFQTRANSDTQTYEVTLNMKTPEGVRLNPGMTAEVSGTMPTARSGYAVNIPISSVAGTPDGPKYVWLLKDDNVVSKCEVQVGRIANGMFAVQKGLSQGDVVVMAGVNYLNEGQKVKVLDGRIGGRE